MIRYYVVLHRGEGISREAFLRAWTVEHAALARALPGVLAVATHPSLEGADFDGIGVLDFADERSLAACLASPEGQAVRAHTATFADPDRAQRFIVQVGQSLSGSYDG